MREAHECFHVLRAFDFALSKAALLRSKRDQLKPEVIWNIEEGLKLTVEQLERAEAQRVAMTARTLEFFKNYDLLLTPATIVPPFAVENRYVAECAGKKFDNYVEWLGIVYAITLVCCPALSLPCGFTASGLPGRAADGGAAARRGAVACRRQGAGGYSWCARHHADRSEAAEIAEPSRPIRSGRITMPMERFQFAGSEGHQLAAALDLPEREPIAYALFAHCFTCGKDVLAARRIATELANKGIAVLRFDFTGLGLQRGRFRQFDLLLQRRRPRARRRSSAPEPAKPRRS